MCGFAGFYGQGENRNEILGEMLETIIHRGPDSEGRYLDEKVALGFRRLSIVDLSEHGNQPMFNEDESLVLTFNGEIYNYKELLLELLAAGHTFHSHTDSEVLLHGYEEWGTELVTKLRGMFAFVIWDKKKEQLFGARDMFGIKPFYYSKMENVFLFGSEIKSLLMHPQFHKELNEDALRLYLSFQFVPTDETFFKNVFCLPPAHYFIYDGKECKTGEVGELLVRGDNVMKGYWHKDKETKKVLIADGWLRTGDLAYLDKDKFVYIVDRIKDLIIVNGENIYPGEVEDCIYEYEGVSECAVVGHSDSLRGQAVWAYIVMKEGYTLDENEIRKFMKGRIATYKIPRHFIEIDEMPKNSTGKILKRALRK